MCGRYTLRTKDFTMHYGVEQGTFEFSSLQTQVQAARLSVRRAEAKKQQAAGKQWVKTPVAGLVADIRLVELGVAGVTLEVVIDRDTLTD